MKIHLVRVKKNILLILLFLLANSYQTGLAKEFSSQSQSISHYKITLSPIAGYTSTYGAIVGGNFILYPLYKPGHYFRFKTALTLDGIVDVGAEHRFWMPSQNILRTRLSYSTFFDPYYGEGSRTQVSNQVLIQGRTSKNQVEFLHRLDNEFAVGGFLDFRHRSETGSNSSPSSDSDTVSFPNESTLGLGLLVENDTRNQEFNPRRGNLTQLKLTFVPDQLSTIQQLQSFAQGEVDSRWYTTLVGKLVLATRANLGATVLVNLLILSDID